MNPTIENETKSGNYIFKPDAIFISMISKIEVSQFYDKSEPKQWKWTKIRYFFMGHIQIRHYIFFYQIMLKCFNDFRNRNFSVLWLTWNQTMEMKPKSVIFPGDIFKSDIIFHWSQNIKLFQWLLYLAHDFYKFNTNI